MAATDATHSYVGLIEQPDTVVLRGAAARTPLAAGQMIVGSGTFSDGTATELGIFLVLRQVSAKSYLLAPFGTKDADWSKWLDEKTAVTAVLLRAARDPIPEDDELLRRWRVVSEKGEVPLKKDYLAFGKKIADGIEKKWAFLNELVVSEKPPPQAATVPHFSVIVNNNTTNNIFYGFLKNVFGFLCAHCFSLRSCKSVPQLMIIGTFGGKVKLFIHLFMFPFIPNK